MTGPAGEVGGHAVLADSDSFGVSPKHAIYLLLMVVGLARRLFAEFVSTALPGNCRRRIRYRSGAVINR